MSLKSFTCFMCLLTHCNWGFAAPLTLQHLAYYTESYPPFNYHNGSKFTGIAVDLLIEASQAMGSPLTSGAFVAHPWARSYQVAQAEPHNMLFTTIRTPQRAPLFQWVGPIDYSEVVILGRADHALELESIQSLTSYRVGVIRHDIGHQILKKHRIAPSSLIESSFVEELLIKLEKGRVDAIVCDYTYVEWYLATQAPEKSDVFQRYLTVDKFPLYYALSKDVPTDLVERLQTQIERLQTPQGGHSFYQQLKAQYFR